MAVDLSVLLLVLVAAGLGWWAGRVAGRARHRDEVTALRSALAHERADRPGLQNSFEALSAQALERNNRAFLDLAEQTLEQRRQAVEHLVSPLREALGRVEGHLRQLETARATAYASLAEQVTAVRQSSDRLRTETATLAAALRKPSARGSWGEMSLRRAVEVAGMSRHCDFDVQPTLAGPEGAARPDMVVHLAGGKQVVVDSKVPLDAFLDAHIEASCDERRRADRLAAHARALRGHVDALASKAYWARCPSTPEFVVLFVPQEAFLAAALEADPGLLDHAAGRRVVLATPTTLIALLRTVAYAWSQAALADDARSVYEAGRELYARLGVLGDHVDKLGRALGTAVTSYNRAVGSLESRVLVSARKLAGLGLANDPLPSPAPVEVVPRRVAAVELVELPDLRVDADPIEEERADDGGCRCATTLPAELVDDDADDVDDVVRRGDDEGGDRVPAA